MARRLISSGSPFEPTVGYSRAVRVGERIFVSGTAPQWPDGHVDPDPAAQAERCIAIVRAALEEAGAGLGDVVRTRLYLVDGADFDAVAGVHGRHFASVRPANTTVVVGALLDPRWRLELEVEAVVDPDAAPLEPLEEGWSRLLAVAAHPDDLEYGAASAVARWTAQGKDVRYLLVTRGEAGIDGLTPQECGSIREAEEREGAALVGVTSVDFLDHRDGVVAGGLALRRDLCREIRRHRPDRLLTVSYDLTWPGGHLNMADHRLVGLAVLDAARDAGNRWIFPELAEEGLEPWDGVRAVFVSGTSHPTHAVDVTDTIEAGVASLAAHRQYLAALPDGTVGAEPGGFLREGARALAPRFGGRPAVGFDVILI